MTGSLAVEPGADRTRRLKRWHGTPRAARVGRRARRIMRRMAIADRFDHVSIATRKMASMVPLVRDVLGARFLMGAEETARHFRWAQFQLPGGGIIELMEPTDDDGFVARFLKRRGEGGHHLTLRGSEPPPRPGQLETAGSAPGDLNPTRPPRRQPLPPPQE